MDWIMNIVLFNWLSANSVLKKPINFFKKSYPANKNPSIIKRSATLTNLNPKFELLSENEVHILLFNRPILKELRVTASICGFD